MLPRNLADCDAAGEVAWLPTFDNGRGIHLLIEDGLASKAAVGCDAEREGVSLVNGGNTLGLTAATTTHEEGYLGG